jgi:hypothetical protein
MRTRSAATVRRISRLFMLMSFPAGYAQRW